MGEARDALKDAAIANKNGVRGARAKPDFNTKKLKPVKPGAGAGIFKNPVKPGSGPGEFDSSKGK